jgi:DNA polymerase III subunit epsilon
VIAGWDTETTGLPKWQERSNHPDQPHIVQLAVVTCSDDGQELSAASWLVRPDGWEIPPAMTEIHGITNERALAEGLPEDEVVALWLVAQAKAKCRVAHNEQFDRRIMRIAMLRAGYQRDFVEKIEARESFCTQQKSHAIIKATPTHKMLAAGIMASKTPSLKDCVRHFFDQEIDGAHDALVDTRWTLRVYWKLREIGL